MTRKSDLVPQDLAAILLDALRVEEVMPRPALREAILRRVAGEEARHGFTIVRDGATPWHAFVPGVSARVVFDDGRVQTWLARLEADARVPAHIHQGDEEIYVLEGTCSVEEVQFTAGDYMMARAGTAHGEMRSAAGCLLLLRTPSPSPAPA